MRTDRRLQVTSYRLIILIFALCAMLYALCGACFAKTISSADLINSARSYEGRAVAYEGEVIGDIMVRGNYAWININDGSAAIGIWIPKELVKDIKYTGRYQLIGDWVEARGVFWRACPEHGGDLDIHATMLKVVRQGFAVSEAIPEIKVKMAIVLFSICLAVILVYFIKIGYIKRAQRR